jgi:CDGSH-type Zn-finger protein
MHEEIIIRDREELFYLLSEAAEFEHTVMCSYLYTAWTLTGRTVLRTENARLCRCGGSGSKPLCDGTHARIGFRTETPTSETLGGRPAT